MSEYIISCCSTADLSKEHFTNRNIHYICFHYFLDGKPYADDLGQSMPFDKFYEAMANGADTKTSQINMEEFVEYFEPFLQEGKDIIHLTLSSGISGVYNSAMLAKEELAEKYPDRKIYIIDSLAASSGYGLLMDKLADLRDEGMDIDTLAKWAEDNRLKLNHWFFSTDLTFYVKGGRISQSCRRNWWHAEYLSTVKCRSGRTSDSQTEDPHQEKVIVAIAEKMKELAENGTDYNGKCYISQSACYEDARAVADLVEAAFPHLNGKVEINSIGTTIGSHTGPGTVALFFWGQERTN